MPKSALFSTFIVISAFCLNCHQDSISNEGYFKGADNADIFYKIIGDNEDTLVILHGGPGAGMHSFMPSIEPIQKDFTLIFFDQRGGGKSVLPDSLNKLKPEYYVEDLESLRKFFDLEKMDVIAHSFGSLLIAEYAKGYPQHLNRILYHGATGPIRANAGKYYQLKAANAIPIEDTTLIKRSSELLQDLLNGSSKNPVADCYEYEEISRKIAAIRGEKTNYAGTTCQASKEAISYYYKNTAQFAPSYYGNWDYSNELLYVSSPVLIVYGKEDSLGIPQQTDWVNSYPNAELLLVPNAGKGAFSDNFEFLSPKVVSFFKAEK